MITIILPCYLFVVFPSFFLCSPIWNNVFLKADLTFIFSPKCYNLFNLDADLPYFEELKVANLYTPLRLIVICHTSSQTLTPSWPKSLRPFKYRSREKSARTKSTFVQLEQTPWSTAVAGYLSCEYLILILGEVFRQEYIFINANPHRDAVCFERAANILGTTKLIIFEKTVTSTLLIPCLTCKPIVFQYLEIITFQEIGQAWHTHNKDMHKYSAFVDDSINTTCGLLHSGFTNSKYPDFCPIATIAAKYNLTLIEDHVFSYSYNESFGRLLVTRLNHFFLRDAIFQVNFKSFNFVTVTNPSTHASGVETFVSPLDVETWICLLISVVSTVGFLACQGTNRNILTVTMVADKLITITSLLLGQVGETSGKPYQTGKVILILITLWFFGNLILMSNVYQGMIYSCLAVLVPPQTPSGMDDLVNWDIPIVAMDIAFDSRTNTYKPYLSRYIIPELILSSEQNPKFMQFLTKFKAKISSISTKSVSTMVDTVFLENSDKSHQTIALLCSDDVLDDIAKQIKFQGNRRGVRNRGDSPFRNVEFKVGIRNLLAPYFAKEWRNLNAAGLNQMWNKVYRISLFLRVRGTHLGKQKYFEVTQSFFGNPREGVVFHEATPVSVGLIRPIFAICAVILAIAVVQFMAESKICFRNKVTLRSVFCNVSTKIISIRDEID